MAECSEIEHQQNQNSFFNYVVGQNTLTIVHKNLKAWLESVDFIKEIKPDSEKECQSNCNTRAIRLGKGIRKNNSAYLTRYRIECAMGCQPWIESVTKCHRGYGRADEIYWENSPEINKWRDNSWEVAKLFMPNLGRDKTKKGKEINMENPDDHDLSNLLNLLQSFKPFELNYGIDRKIPMAVLDVRNKISHSKTFKVDREDLISYIDCSADLLEVLNCPEDEVKRLIKLKELKLEEIEQDDYFLAELQKSAATVGEINEGLGKLLGDQFKGKPMNLIVEVEKFMESTIDKTDAVKKINEEIGKVKELEKISKEVSRAIRGVNRFTGSVQETVDNDFKDTGKPTDLLSKLFKL